MKFVSLNSLIHNLTHAKPNVCFSLHNATNIAQFMSVIADSASFVNLNSEGVELKAESWCNFGCVRFALGLLRSERRLPRNVMSCALMPCL